MNAADAEHRAHVRQESLAREVQHRTKNLFSVVHTIVARSFANKRTVLEAEIAVRDRLHSLAQTHAILDKDWLGADLVQVVRTEMCPYADRVSIDGPVLC
jgi:two-component sensor histidine kinase